MLFWDDNGITIDGSTELSFTEDVRKRFDAYGWQVLDVADVNDLSAVESAISKGKANTSQPTIVCVKTVIGAGCKKQGTHGCHGAPLGAEDLGNTKVSLFSLSLRLPCLALTKTKKLKFIRATITNYYSKLTLFSIICFARRSPSTTSTPTSTSLSPRRPRRCTAPPRRTTRR